MKNLLLTFLFCFSFLAIGTSQASFGAGVAYYNDFGVQGRANIEMDKLTIIPKFTYYFVDPGSAWVIDGDLAYDVAMIDENPVYAFAGPSFWKFTGTSEFGINIGVGARFSNIYAELRWSKILCDFCGDDIGFAAGYMF